jgi:hypothetical protein
LNDGQKQAAKTINFRRNSKLIYKNHEEHLEFFKQHAEESIEH